jgi:50S ribosomal subunit-associated GTPase HflX
LHSQTVLAPGSPVVRDAGAEHDRSIGPVYCRATAIVAHDQSDAASAAGLRKWADLSDGGVAWDHRVVAAANKDDLEVKTVSAQEVEEWWSDGGIWFFRVSAKRGVGIDSMVKALTDDLAGSETFAAIEGEADPKRPEGRSCCRLPMAPDNMSVKKSSI